MKVAMSTLRLIAFGFLTAAVTVFWSGSLAAQDAAQNYDVMPYADKYMIPEEEEEEIDPFDINERKKPKSSASRQIEQLRASDQTKAVEGLRAGRTPEADALAKEFLIPQMTQFNNLSGLGTLRKNFFSKFLNASSGPTRKTLIEQTCLPTFKTIVEGNFHPSARLNAVLIIGNLNDVDADSSEKAAPIPNSQAVKYLLGLVESVDTPEFVRVGAMTGLHRIANIEYAQKRADPGDVSRIYQVSLATAQGKAPGQESWSEEVSYWLKRRSAQMLGFLKNKGPGNEAVTTLLEILADDNAQAALRMDAMTALREMGVEGDKVKSVIDTVITMAALTLEAEAKEIRRLVEEYVSIGLLLDDKYLIDAAAFAKGIGDKDGPGMAGGMDGGDIGSTKKKAGSNRKEGFDIPNHAINTIRRKLKSSLYHLHKTLSNETLTNGLSPEDSNRIRRARKIIEAALRDTDIGLIDLSKPDAEGPYDDLLKENVVSEVMYERLMKLSQELKNLK